MNSANKSATKIELVRERCLASVFWCGWYLCGYRDISIVLHFAISLWFHKRLSAGKRWFLVMIPRGHFKTSLLNHAFSVHEIINNPNMRILVVMHNLEESKKKFRKLKSIMVSREMATYFPGLVTGDKKKFGTATEFTVKRTGEFPEATVTAAGLSTGVVGGHYDIVIVDDGVDRKAANSAAQMVMAVDFIESVDPLFEDEDSILMVIGTLWPGGEHGYYEGLMENDAYESLILGCYINEAFHALLQEVGVKLPFDNVKYINTSVKKANRDKVWQTGQPIFPERRTMRGLAQSRRNMKEYKFAHQMLNVKLDSSKRRFLRKDFRPYNLEFDQLGNPQSVWLNKVAYPYSRGIVSVCMDPTGGMNKSSDDCGITACWWYPPARFGCLLDFYHEQGPSPKEQITRFLEMGIKWDADVLRPESGSMQVWVAAWLKQEMVRLRKFFEVDPYSPGGVAKGRRILDGFQPYVASHEFFVLYPEHEEVVEHLVSLNIAPDGTIMGDSPALADTFPMHAEYWIPGNEPKNVDGNKVVDEDQFKKARERRQQVPVRYGLKRRVAG